MVKDYVPKKGDFELVDVEKLSGLNDLDKKDSSTTSLPDSALNNPSVSYSPGTEDPIREAVKKKNNKTTYGFKFVQPVGLKIFNQTLGLTPTGQIPKNKSNDKVLKLIYDTYDKNIKEKLFDSFASVFPDTYGYQEEEKKQKEDNFFADLSSGLEINSFDPESKNNIDIEEKAFDANKSYKNFKYEVLKKCIEDPTILGLAKEKPKISTFFISTDPEIEKYYNSTFYFDQEELKEYLNEIYSPEKNYSVQQKLFDPASQFINFNSTEKFIDFDVLSFLNKIYSWLSFYVNNFFPDSYIYGHPNQTENSTTEYNFYFLPNNVEKNNSLKSKTFKFHDFVRSRLPKILNLITQFDDNLLSFPGIKIENEIKLDEQKLLSNINNSKFEKLFPLLISIDDIFNEIISAAPDFEFYRKYNYAGKDTFYLTDRNIFKDFNIIKKLSFDKFFNTIKNNLIAFNNYYTDFIKEFEKQIELKYYNVYGKIIGYEVSINAAITNFPAYTYNVFLYSPTLYGRCPEIDLELLYNKKTDIYIDKDPKILFSFEKPQILTFKNKNTPIINTPEKYIPNKFQAAINNLQPPRIYIYKTDANISSIKDIFFEQNLYKTLDVYKNNGELSFYENLTPNKDYYYFYIAEWKSPTDFDQYNDISVIKDKYIMIDGIDIYYICSPIIKLKLVKDDTFYYLEKSFLTPKSFIKTEYGDKFKENVIFIPNSQIFSLGKNSFSNKQKYLKVRVTSKKTRKKIDLNLKYTLFYDKITISKQKKDLSDAELVIDMTDAVLKNTIEKEFEQTEVSKKFKSAQKK